MLRNILIAVGVVFALGIIASFGDESPAAPAIEVSAMDLVLEYGRNEIAADSKFRDKTIKVTGIVEDVGKDLLDTPYIILSGTGLRAVQCFFADRDSEPLTRIQRGQWAAVQGKCDGLLVNVLINKSKIVP